MRKVFFLVASFIKILQGGL